VSVADWGPERCFLWWAHFQVPVAAADHRGELAEVARARGRPAEIAHRAVQFRVREIMCGIIRVVGA
jgi:hypothetical protein